MNDMNKIFQITGETMDVKNIQQTSMEFQVQMEKQEIIQEQLEEATNMDDDEDVINEEAESIIQGIEDGLLKKKIPPPPGGGNGGGMVMR